MIATKRVAASAGGVWLLLSAVPSMAHDLWIVPGKFVLQPGEKVRVFVNSGDEYPKSDSLLGRYRVQSFDLMTASGKSPVDHLATNGKSLTAEVAIPTKGTAVLALAVEPRLVRLKAEDFNAYLKEDGLPQILAEREQKGELDRPVIERYTKWAKAVLEVGQSGDEVWRQPVGHRMEIVPEKNPYQVRPGEKLPVRVLYEGKAISGLTVSGGSADGPRNELRSVTDSGGRARVTIRSPGRWYLRTIHMIRLPEESPIHWESFWATLTFEVKP